MRFLFLVCLYGLLSLTGFSQSTSGHIIYEEKKDLHRGLPPHMEMHKDRIPPYRTVKKELYFTNQESLYAKMEMSEEERKERKSLAEQKGRRWRGPKRGQEKRTLYTDIADGTSVETNYLLEKAFLIEGRQREFKWKVTAEQKKVGSYLCQKATYQDSTILIDAWFTPMIPVSSGPADFGKLPGMILHVDINEGEETITAIQIDMKDIPEGIIAKPKEGEKIERTAYEALQEEKMGERKALMGDRRRMRPFNKR